MSNIVEISTGVRVSLQRVAEGSTSPVTKQGAFYVFSVRVDNEDIREYSFTDRQRAVDMRKVLVGHIEQKLTKGNVKKLVGVAS
mgnify:FL=1